MSWTYTDSPGSVARDRIRFLVGDTKQTSASLSDDEIAFLIAETGNVPDQYEAAAQAAEAMAAKMTALSATSKKVGDLSLTSDNGQSASGYLTRAAALRARLTTRIMFLPVVSEETAADPVFTLGMDDNA
jgi:hypothetical protein